MLRKKQINLLISSGVLLITLVLFVFFSPEKKELIKNEPSPTPTIADTYTREVLGSVSNGVNLDLDNGSETIIHNEAVGIQPSQVYEVVKVVDGDTVDVDLNGKIERLRLIGIDTPETVDPRKKVQCFGVEASNKSKEMLLGKFVYLEADPSQSERDKYSRLLRYIFLPDGTNFNQYMIAEGYAYEYTYDEAYKYQLEFKNAQKEAELNKKGMWNPDVCPK